MPGTGRCGSIPSMIALVEARRAGLFAANQWLPNIIAGVIVGVVALPLAMAFAIASGARPEQGLYTAIIGGACVSIFGGSRVQIAGPTGAFVAILSGITAKYGIAGLADRHPDGGHHARADGSRPDGGGHPVHSGAGDRGLHRRHRRDHIRRAVARFPGAASR